ncbi:hypothetical protein E1281_04775, partial [Actinomadura sp. KC345]|uniref:hypothetical protein n=1 Tax=Actinomadura sp. KC345 TaxID=2530371 RepID=UPI001043D864
MPVQAGERVGQVGVPQQVAHRLHGGRVLPGGEALVERRGARQERGRPGRDARPFVRDPSVPGRLAPVRQSRRRPLAQRPVAAPEHVVHDALDVLDDQEGVGAGGREAGLEVGGEPRLVRQPSGEPAVDAADVRGRARRKAGEAGHAPRRSGRGPVDDLCRRRPDEVGRAFQPVPRSVVGDRRRGPQQRGGAERVLEEPVEAVAPVLLGRRPPGGVGDGRVLRRAVGPPQQPQDLLVVVMAAPLAQVRDPVAAALRRQPPRAPRDPLVVFEDALPQVEDQVEPARPRQGFEDLPQVPPQHRGQAARDDVGVRGLVQREDPFQLLGPEHVAGGHRQMERGPAPLLHGLSGRRADPPGDRGPEQRHQEPGPVPQPPRAPQAHDPKGRQDRVPLVAARPVQPRGPEPGPQLDARPGRDHSP